MRNPIKDFRDDLKQLIQYKMIKSTLPFPSIIGRSRKTAYKKLNEVGTMALYEMQNVCDKLDIGIALYDKDRENCRIERKNL